MNQETYNDVQDQAAGLLEKMVAEKELALKLSARERVVEVLEEKVDTGDVLLLTDEELRMVRCFRKFKLRNSKPGVVFKWQTHPEAGIVTVAEDEAALIVDAQDANA